MEDRPALGERKANAARIVACVNALEGYDTAILETCDIKGKLDDHFHQWQRAKRAESERDALRAEVERLREALREVARIPADYDVCPQIAMRMYDAARAALGGGK